MRRIPRGLARAPVPLFKAGLGVLFGGRLVMVEHVGRKSGLPRQAVLEVLLAEGPEVVVASGYGWSAQWLRNVAETPRVRLWRGRRRGVPARARILPPDESRRLLERYRKVHPGQARTVATALGLPELVDPAPLPADVGERIPLVRVGPA